MERICFQVEEAQWFYEDFIRPLDPNLPSLPLRNFCLRIFQHCPLLSEFSPYHHSTAFSEFLAYKTRVPVRGAIMLNQSMDQVVLVKGWKKGAYWSFPRGKINKDEKDLDCAIREVYEETGFDILGAGLVGKEEDTKFIEVTMREQHMRLYVFRGVPMDTYFEPRTRKEISKIQWFKLSELPTLKRAKQQQEGRGEDLATNANKFYMVAPFLVPLKKWIAQQSKRAPAHEMHADHMPPPELTEEPMTEEELLKENHDNEPATGNMDRLLNHLRQSSQRQIPSNLPEVSDSQKSSIDASIQLKRLLSVKGPSPPSSTPTLHTNSRTDTARSNSLLALLRGETTAADTGETYDRAAPPPPHTPMEQITTFPTMPRSPDQHHQRPSRLLTHPPPPPFTFSPPDIDHRHPQHSAGHPPPSADMNPPHYPNLAHNRGAQYMGPPSHFPSVQGRAPATTQLPLFTHSSYGPVMTSASQQVQEAPAPYHRSGDPRFAPAPQFPNLHAPSIPPASKLPLPQLSSHSLSLLNAFRNDKAKETTVTQETVKDPLSSISALNLGSTDDIRQRSVTELGVLGIHDTSRETHPIMVQQFQTTGGVSNMPTVSKATTKPNGGLVKVGNQATESVQEVKLSQHNIARAMAPIGSENRNTVSENKARTQHQDALLDLFRRPIVSTTDTPKASAPASLVEPAPVELSAQPSVTPSINRPLKKHPNPVLATIDTSTRTSTTLASAHSKHAIQEPPTSATVTGPLDMPHFEGLTKKAKEAPVKVKSSTSNGVVQKSAPKASPMSILRRPAPAQQAAHEVAPSKEPGPIAVAKQRTPDRRPKPSSEPVPKPFQPQILRRPAQAPQRTPSSTAPQIAKAPSPQPQPTLSYHDHDHEISHTEPNKRHTPPPSTSHNPPPKMKPISTLQATTSAIEPPPAVHKNQPSPPVPTQLDLTRVNVSVTPARSRSRIGSVFSSASAGDGSPKPSSPMTPNDRSFLLGYLQGVVKGERR